MKWNEMESIMKWNLIKWNAIELQNNKGLKMWKFTNLQLCVHLDNSTIAGKAADCDYCLADTKNEPKIWNGVSFHSWKIVN